MYYIVVLFFGFLLLYKNFTTRGLFRCISKLPYVNKKIKNKVNNEIDKFRSSLEKDRFTAVNLNNLSKTISIKGMSIDQIMKRVDMISQYSKDEYKISGAVYVDETQWETLIGTIYGKTAWLNPTHNSIWPNLIQLESELYRICSELFYLSESYGILTSGGTISNIEAVYAYRCKYEYEKNIIKPNIVAPSSAHSSFRKACQILKIEYKMCKLDDKGKANLKDMEKLIDGNTILLIGSSPSFPYGIIDPIEKISDLALKYKIGMHLDACLGGFQIPFINLNEKCDFRNKGITSISADLHKFGKTPKGISILMFRNYEIKKYLTYVDLKWSGGLYVMADFPGSRPGAMIVISWAMINMIGYNQYKETTEKLIRLRKEICDQINSRFNNDLYVYGEPELSTFGIKSDKYNIHFVDKIMKNYEWEFNMLPDGLHFCLTEKHLIKDGFKEMLLDDLENSIKYIKGHPDEDPGSNAKIYCSMQEIPNFAEDILEEIGRVYIDIQTRIEPSEKTND